VIMGQLDLKYHTILTTKEIFTARKIKLPHADKSVVIFLANLGDVRPKAPAPMPQCFCSMANHDFDIQNLQPLRASGSGHLLKRWQIATRKNIFIQPAITAPCRLMNPDRMYHRNAIWR